jgi:hypothetical protein
MVQATDQAPIIAAREEKLQAWREDPVLYFEQRLGISPDRMDEHEKAMLRALPEAILQKKPIVVTSANAMGKDWTISGRASLWFFECFGPCKVIMTATGERQVLDVMWSEMKAAYNSRPDLDEMGKMVSGKLEAGDNWFISAFTTREQKDQPGKFQGAHSPRLMVIVSEAQGVEDIIFEQIESLTMADVCLAIYLGNPLTNVGRFAKMIDDPENNIIIRLNAYDCVNVKEKKVILPGLVTWDWVQDKEKRWNADGSGRDPRYMARVLGLKPTSSINSVISKDLYTRCVRRPLSWWSDRRGSIGVDPALTGVDDMVLYAMESGKFLDKLVIPNCEAPEACAKIAAFQKKNFPEDICTVTIDCDGLGAPIAQFYRKMKPNTVELIEFKGSCSDHKVIGEEYLNHRSEASFYAKQRMLDGHISLPEDEQCEEEATTELYFTNRKNGRLQIEDKVDIKSRLGRSPNTWDAAKLAIWGFKTAKAIKRKDSWRADANGGSSIVPDGATSFMGA